MSAQLGAVDKGAHTALHLAAIQGHDQVVQYLVQLMAGHLLGAHASEECQKPEPLLLLKSSFRNAPPICIAIRLQRIAVL